jgi:hypothetical protein
MGTQSESAFAALLAKACSSPHEFRTVDELALVLNMSLRTFQRRCSAHGIRAKEALDFVRCAAVVLESKNGTIKRFSQI